MKRLDQITKKQIFNVPDGYFESLPLRIQARIATEPEATPNIFSYFFRFKHQILLPVALLAVLSLIWFEQSNDKQMVEEMLASVETHELIAYIESSNLSLDELLNEIEPSDVEPIENLAYEIPLNEDIIDNIILN